MTVGDHHLRKDEKSQIDVEVLKIFVMKIMIMGKSQMTLL